MEKEKNIFIFIQSVVDLEKKDWIIDLEKKDGIEKEKNIINIVI